MNLNKFSHFKQSKLVSLCTKKNFKDKWLTDVSNCYIISTTKKDNKKQNERKKMERFENINTKIFTTILQGLKYLLGKIFFED